MPLTDGSSRRCAFGAALAASALAVVVGGCGGSSSGGVDPVASAAEVTSQQGGAQLILRGSATTARGKRVLYSGTGFMNLRTGDAFLATSLTAKARRIQIVERFTGGSLYMTSPAFHGELPGGAAWIKVDLAKAARSAGLGSLSSTTTDPAESLAKLKAAGNVRDAGRETVQGMATTHYVASIDLVRAAELAPGAQKEKARRFAEKLVSLTGRRYEPVEVWVDAQRRIRRVVTSFAQPVPGHGALAQRLEVEYASFGPTPAVNAPPSGEVFDATSQSERALRKL